MPEQCSAPAPLPRILLVDDDPAMRRLLERWLEMDGYEVRSAPNGQEATEVILDDPPQLLITDWDMPHMDGLELCRWLRSTGEIPHYIYSIMLTTRKAADDTIRGLQAGADDFLQKPVDHGELMARLQSGSRLLELETRLTNLARTDPLTSLPNQRTFYERVEAEWSRALRHNIPLSCVMLDIDFFKRINDTHGHRAGDEVIRQIAAILTESIRASDIVSRYGGEEFAILLPETVESDAVLWAERVRENIATRRLEAGDLELKVTASLGVSERLSDTDSPEALVDLADQALLVAKRSGRDRVVTFQASVSSENKPDEGGPQEILEGIQARDLMASLVAGLNVDASVGSAARYFLHFRIGSAPVVDHDGKLVGILSEKDVMSIMLLPRWWDTTIREVMKSNVVCYDEDTPAITIYEFLCRVSIRSIIVVKGGKPTGVISRGSLLRWVINHEEIENPCSENTPESECETGDDGRSQDRVALTARALSREAVNLEQSLQEGVGTDLTPVLVGGASRIQELVNDLLAISRFVNAGENVTGAAMFQAGNLPS